ncbi:MAG TPA: sigma-70 family RNA polymerase sigma factor [Candidatus Acidoferrum sp.]|nr:sigma-70 family RNA polymerase sigma factor [Candidatus Acidoferrum sp.]
MDPRKLSTQELVSYCLDSQDEAGWTEFVRRFQPLIAGVVNRCVCRRGRPNPPLVDDLVQDTFLKLCRNNYKALRNFEFQHDNAFFGFLKVVAANVAEDHYRREEADKHGGGHEEENIEEAKIPLRFSPSSLKPAEMAILMGQLERCLTKLASEPNFARDHAIFWLYYRQGLTAKAIAELPAIRLSVKGVESTLLRLTRFVKVCLTNPPPPPRKKASGG